MEPFRIITSRAELAALRVNSLVCAVVQPASAYRKAWGGSADIFVTFESTRESDVNEAWAVLTTHCPADAPEVWVLWDAAAEAPAPLKPSVWMTVIPGRRPIKKAHTGLGLAKSAITHQMSGGVATLNMSLQELNPATGQYDILHFIPAGTPPRPSCPGSGKRNAMNPYRSVRSEAELEDVVPGSLVCPAYSLRTIYEKLNVNAWVEPGSEEEITTAALWEVLTGAYETIILDEDREVWVLIDAAAPGLVRPPRGEDSPDYLTRARPGDRDIEWVTHASLAEARAAIESLLGAGTAAKNMLIYAREDKDRIDFYPVEHIVAGTTAPDLPWVKSAI